MWFGSTTGCPPEISKFIKPECLDQPFLLFSNFELSHSLEALLREVVAATGGGDLSRSWDASGMRALLQLQTRCQHEFDACARASREQAASRRPEGRGEPERLLGWEPAPAAEDGRAAKGKARNRKLA